MGRHIPGVSIANNFDLNTLVHRRGEDSTDEILIHPASEFTHPITCENMSNKSVEANHKPKSLAGSIVREPGGNITTTLTVGGGNCKAGRIDTRCSLGSSISL